MQEVVATNQQLLSIPRPFRLTLSDVTGRSSLHARFVLCSLHNGSYLIGRTTAVRPHRMDVFPIVVCALGFDNQGRMDYARVYLRGVVAPMT